MCTSWHTDRYIGSLFRVDEPTPMILGFLLFLYSGKALSEQSILYHHSGLMNCLHVYIWFLHSGSSCQLPNGKPIERVCISGLSFTSLTNASVKSELGTMLCSIYAR